MSVVTMRELLEAGVHFGHQTRRWNPKMRRFIFGERGGIYIIDLQQTIQLLDDAYGYVRNVAERGGTVMFVGTKKQAQDSVEEHARRVGMPYVNHRWLGGLLTNFRTIQDRITALHELRRQRTEGQLQLLPPKERQTVLAELEKLETNLGGVADARRLPDAVVVVDLKKETLAVREARRLRIPVIGLVDTNCDPDDADFVIPGNDDAIRSTTLIVRVLADGIAQGRAKGMRVGDFAAADANGDAPATADEAAPEQVEALAEVAAAQGEAEAPAAAAAAAGGRRGPGRGARGPAGADQGRRVAAGRGGPDRGRRRRRGRAGGDDRRGGGVVSETSYRASPAEVKTLREATQAGMMDCKRALEETGGDMDAAVRLLRERGMASATKRAGRGTTEGIVEAYVHGGGKVGVLVEIGCETDFVARTDDFRAFARTVALQVAAMRGLQFVSEAEIPEDFKRSEIEVYRNKAAGEGKPGNMLDRISEGMWNKSLTEIVLLSQPSIRPEHEGKTIEALRAELSGRLGENIEIKRFARFEIGAA